MFCYALIIHSIFTFTGSMVSIPIESPQAPNAAIKELETFVKSRENRVIITNKYTVIKTCNYPKP